MQLQSYLDRMGVWYHLSHHAKTYTAADLAESEHISGDRVIKPVLVKADGRFVLCALPASYRIDLGRLREMLHADKVGLADENQLAEMFPDCEVGAEPPIGFLYGLSTLMDENLCKDERVTFQAGSHEAAVTMRMEDYRRIAQPEVGRFGRHI
jgi:Ala-tRNA(Pro) deacylase